MTARAHNKAKDKWSVRVNDAGLFEITSAGKVAKRVPSQAYHEAVLRDALRLVAVDLCPKMTDDEFEDIWRGFLEIRRLKGMPLSPGQVDQPSAGSRVISSSQPAPLGEPQGGPPVSRRAHGRRS